MQKNLQNQVMVGKLTTVHLDDKGLTAELQSSSTLGQTELTGLGQFLGSSKYDPSFSYFLSFLLTTNSRHALCHNSHSNETGLCFVVQSRSMSLHSSSHISTYISVCDIKYRQIILHNIYANTYIEERRGGCI